MKKLVYLAGHISPDPATFEWRRRAHNLLKPWFTVINPMTNLWNLRLKDRFKLNEIWEFETTALAESQNLLIHKDFQNVSSSHIMLANLSIDAERPYIGTLFELDWCWMLRKPVVAIISKTNWYSIHPFINSTISAKVSSVEEGCDMVKAFFTEKEEREPSKIKTDAG